MMPHVSKEELLSRLELAIGAQVGIEGLNTLLYGWKKFRKFGAKYLDELKHRNWFYITEVMDLSGVPPKVLSHFAGHMGRGGHFF